MDYLDKLRVFRSVVEARSFTRAADMHGLARPVVSRAIAELEEHLGCRLLNRTTRQLSLTEAAERIYARCSQILDEVDALEADAQVQAREPDGLLRLVAHTTATLNGVAPLIAGFKKAFPKVRLDVTLTERPVDLVADGYDLGIVVPFMLNSDKTVVRLLKRIPVVLVATPAYLREHHAPSKPTDLLDHHFVSFSPSLRRPTLAFRVDGKDVPIPYRFDISSNNPEFNLEMVMNDLGIGVIPETLVKAQLADGTLVRVLADVELLDSNVEVKLAYASRALLPAKVRAFIDYATSFEGLVDDADE